MRSLLLPGRWANPAHRRCARAKHRHGHRRLQGRHGLFRDKAVGRLPRPRGCAVMGRCDQPGQCTLAAGAPACAYDKPAGHSGSRRGRPGVGQYRQQGLPLPRHSLVRQNQAGQLHVRSRGAGTGRQAGPREGLHLVRQIQGTPTSVWAGRMGCVERRPLTNTRCAQFLFSINR